MCGRFYAFSLCLWQIFYALIAVLADFMCQGLSCGICYVLQLHIILWQISSPFIIFVSRFYLWQMFQDIICGTLYDRFFSRNNKNVTYWISRLAFLAKVAFFLCYLGNSSPIFADLFFKWVDCSPKLSCFCSKFAVVFQIWKWRVS